VTAALLWGSIPTDSHAIKTVEQAVGKRHEIDGGRC
jgi:hypothetical protein